MGERMRFIREVYDGMDGKDRTNGNLHMKDRRVRFKSGYIADLDPLDEHRNNLSRYLFNQT